jgi:hypothetical protein
MPLKETITQLEDVEKALRGLYVERDGEFVLDVEGDHEDSADTLRQERKARGAAESALKQLTRELGVTDPVKAIKGLQRFRELEERDLLGPGKWDAAVERRAEEIAAELRAKEGALIGESQRLRAQLEHARTDEAIRSAAVKVGVLPAAIDDAVLFAKRFWALKDGNLVAMNGGEPLYSSRAPNEPMRLDEWMSERAKDRTHWFGPRPPTTAPSNGHQVGRVTITREQAKDPAAYRAAKEQAERTGAELLII